MSRPGFQRRAGASSRWNHNVHYHRVLLRSVPSSARSALDIGCGEGALTRDLAVHVPSVTGIDLDASSIDLARAQGSQHGIAYVLGDALTHPFASESFDVVTSVATLHHMDAGVGLRRMRDLLRPGGTLIVLGLAGSTFREWPLHLLGAIEHRWYTSTRGFWEHPSPQVWPPPVTYPEMRRIATRVLPGARFRRRAMWRYTLIWTKPVRD